MTYDARQTEAQTQTVARMLAAPAGGWKVTAVIEGTLLGVKCENVGIKIESRALRVWGVIMPNGMMVKPKPGRKTIDARDIAWSL